MNLQNKTEQFLNYFEQRIKEDREATFFTFHTALSAHTSDPQNIFFKGDSGIGKTWIVTNVLNLFPEQDVWMLGGLSPTALIHDYGCLMSKDGVPINMDALPNKEEIKEEIQLEKGTVEKADLERALRKAWKQWNENLRDSYYLVDLTGKLLVFLEAPHIETFNRLRPILSHDKPELSYRFTDKDQKGGLRTVHVKIRGWPATIFCTTDKTWLEDLATRSLTITPKTSEAKLRAACVLIGREMAYPKQNGSSEQTKFQTELQNILNYYTNEGLGQIEVLVPYAEQIGFNVPLYQPRVMRDMQHILAFIKLNALVNHEARPKIGKTVLATYEDFFQVLTYFKYCEETTVTGLNQHILDVFHKAMEPLKVFDYKTLVEKCREVLSYPLSQSTLYVYVSQLGKVGWVDSEPDPENRSKRIITVIRNKKNLLSNLIRSFRGFFGLEQFKAWLKQVLETSYGRPVLTNDFSRDWWNNDVEGIFNRYYVPPPENMLDEIGGSQDVSKSSENGGNGETAVSNGGKRLIRGDKTFSDAGVKPDEYGAAAGLGLIPCPYCRAAGKEMFFVSDVDLRAHISTFHEPQSYTR